MILKSPERAPGTIGAVTVMGVSVLAARVVLLVTVFLWSAHPLAA